MHTMRRHRYGIRLLVGLALCALAGGLGLQSGTVRAAGQVTGQWMLDTASRSDGDYQLSLHVRNGSGTMSLSRGIDPGSLRGLDRSASGQVVRFQLVRDAGIIEMEGWFDDGKGGGNFTFAPDGRYRASMAQLGFDAIAEVDQFRLAVHDVSLSFIREMQALGIAPPKESIREIVRLRTHGVTPDYVRSLSAVGLDGLGARELVRLRNHGVTAEYARDLAAAGLDGLSANDLVRLRNHGVSPDFAREVRGLGISADGNDLVRLRNNGVTPDFIRAVQQRGVSELSVQGLIRLRRSGFVAPGDAR